MHARGKFSCFLLEFLLAMTIAKCFLPRDDGMPQPRSMLFLERVLAFSLSGRTNIANSQTERQGRTWHGFHIVYHISIELTLLQSVKYCCCSLIIPPGLPSPHTSTILLRRNGWCTFEPIMCGVTQARPKYLNLFWYQKLLKVAPSTLREPLPCAIKVLCGLYIPGRSSDSLFILSGVHSNGLVSETIQS